jgi:hypothetical protein
MRSAEPSQIVPAAIGIAIWAVGVFVFVTGEQILGAVLVLLGGLGLIIAARGGWNDFIQALARWPDGR